MGQNSDWISTSQEEMITVFLSEKIHRRQTAPIKAGCISHQRCHYISSWNMIWWRGPLGDRHRSISAAGCLVGAPDVQKDLPTIARASVAPARTEKVRHEMNRFLIVDRQIHARGLLSLRFDFYVIIKRHPVWVNRHLVHFSSAGCCWDVSRIDAHVMLMHICAARVIFSRRGAKCKQTATFKHLLCIWHERT